jgi:formylmethanofuran dehydrogenase subunit A
VVMSTDHPNGGSFLAYPQIIRLLMDRTYRQDVLKTCDPLVRERSTLGDLQREYTLNEIAIMFELPRVVIKSGRVIVEQGEIRDPLIGKTLHVEPDYDHEVEADIQKWFEKYYSIRWRNYPVDAGYLHESAVVPSAG